MERRTTTIKVNKPDRSILIETFFWEDMYKCPVCKFNNNQRRHKYCAGCGRKIKWRNDGEKK